MRSFFLLALLSTALTTLAPAQDQTLPPKQRFHLYLLVGQSNMAGRGKVSPEDQQAHPRVLMLNQAGQWVPAIDPMHFDKPAVVGVGPGRSFGLLMAEADPTVTIGLIPCAVGGSPIDTWVPGAFDAPTKTHPWDDAIKRALPALQLGTLKGILWHQGESDSKPILADQYQEKLHALIARFRSTLEHPKVPFITGQMGRFPELPWSAEKKRVDQVHQDLPCKVPNAAFVSATGLKHKGDQVHFDADSARELGRRYAKALQALTPSTKP